MNVRAHSGMGHNCQMHKNAKCNEKSHLTFILCFGLENLKAEMTSTEVTEKSAEWIELKLSVHL